MYVRQTLRHVAAQERVTYSEYPACAVVHAPGGASLRVERDRTLRAVPRTVRAEGGLGGFNTRIRAFVP